MRVEWRGVENLPAGGPYILASNHVSNFDPPAYWVYFPAGPVFFMAKIELFRHPFLRWFLPKTGAFPVKRGEGDEWALRQAGRVLRAGQVLGMYPEGTRSKTARLKRAKPGTVRLALAYGVPVVPAAIANTQNVRWGRRTRVVVSVGKPLDVVALAGSPPYTTETFEYLTLALMRQIAAMLPQEQRGLYSEPLGGK